jgi:hypothetical protein
MGEVISFPRTKVTVVEYPEEVVKELAGLEQALLEFHAAVSELQRVCQAHDDARQVYGTADEDQDDGA